VGTYDPLRDHLSQQSGAVLTFSFDELDAIVPLPISARRHEAWWANEDVRTTAHVQCKAWQAAGYDAEVNLGARTVTFRRKRGHT
jgi:hypothetical protein